MGGKRNSERKEAQWEESGTVGGKRHSGRKGGTVGGKRDIGREQGLL